MEKINADNRHYIHENFIGTKLLIHPYMGGNWQAFYPGLSCRLYIAFSPEMFAELRGAGSNLLPNLIQNSNHCFHEVAVVKANDFYLGSGSKKVTDADRQAKMNDAWLKIAGNKENLDITQSQYLKASVSFKEQNEWPTLCTYIKNCFSFAKEAFPSEEYLLSLQSLHKTNHFLALPMIEENMWELTLANNCFKEAEPKNSYFEYSAPTRTFFL